jgi:hypothetical protein
VAEKNAEAGANEDKTMAGHLARQQAASWPLHQQYEGKIHRMAQSGVREAFHELQEIPTYRGTSKAKVRLISSRW